MENIKKYKIKSERFIMNMPDCIIAKAETLSRKNGVTMSWLYRAVLKALEKKYKTGLEKDLKIQRPDKFTVPFRQITICFYGDKKKWMTLSRIWQVELGPLIRFGLDLFYKGELDVDLESVETVKETKNPETGKIKILARKNSIRCIYLFQNEVELYQPKDFRPKNPKKNIFLMDFGINNRKYPLIL